MHHKSIKRASQGSRRSFKGLIRGSLEMLWELLEVHKAPQATILDTFIVSRASKRPPGGPQVTIYRPCRRFRASRRGTTPLDNRVSRARLGPRTRSRTRFIISLLLSPIIYARDYALGGPGTMNVSTIVAWGAFWTSKSSQSISKEPLGSLLRTPRELLGGFLGALGALLVAFWYSRCLQNLKI